jgi:hypothetical protein
MLALSDESLSTLSEPLPRMIARSSWPTSRTNCSEVLGDGLISRVAAETQRRYLRPPDLSRSRDNLALARIASHKRAMSASGGSGPHLLSLSFSEKSFLNHTSTTDPNRTFGLSGARC